VRIYLTDDANRLVYEHGLDLRVVLDAMERSALASQWVLIYALPLPRTTNPSGPVTVPVLRFEMVELRDADKVLWTARMVP
jgi:hypothetical protein